MSDDLFAGVDDVEDFNKKMKGKSFLRFEGVVHRSAKDPDKRAVIFEYVYEGPDEFFEGEKVTEMFTFHRNLSKEYLASIDDREARNSRKAYGRMLERLENIGFTQAEINQKRANPEDKEGTLVEANIWYNASGYLQIGNMKVVPEKAMQSPSNKSVDDLLS